MTKHRVLLIGSGLMTPPLIEYLLSFNDTHITVVSNLLNDAKALCKKSPTHMDAGYLDVTDVRNPSCVLRIFFSKRRSLNK